MAGRVLYKNGKLMEALHAFEESLAIEPLGNCEAYIGLCIIYSAAGKKSHAETTLRNVKQQFENRPLFLAYWQMVFPGYPVAHHDLEAIDRETQTLKKLFL
jgi:Flp pilus assembly protein TadD